MKFATNLMVIIQGLPLEADEDGEEAAIQAIKEFMIDNKDILKLITHNLATITTKQNVDPTTILLGIIDSVETQSLVILSPGGKDSMTLFQGYMISLCSDEEVMEEF